LSAKMNRNAVILVVPSTCRLGNERVHPLATLMSYRRRQPADFINRLQRVTARMSYIGVKRGKRERL
jgi:hypothetical protein